MLLSMRLYELTSRGVHSVDIKEFLLAASGGNATSSTQEQAKGSHHLEEDSEPREGVGPGISARGGVLQCLQTTYPSKNAFCNIRISLCRTVTLGYQIAAR